jgi:hypothetical protein
MRKHLKYFVFVQLCVVVLLLLGGGRHYTDDALVARAGEQAPVEKYFFIHSSSPISALGISEELCAGLHPVSSNTLNSYSFDWTDYPMVLERLLVSTAVGYFAAITNIDWFKSTDIIYPFHFFW